MKNKRLLLLIFAFALFFSPNVYFAYAHFLGYSSVDEREIRWDGSTQYLDAWNAGIATWNARGSVRIAPDTINAVSNNVDFEPWLTQWP